MRYYGELELKPHPTKGDLSWILKNIPPYVAIKLKDMFRSVGRCDTAPFYLKLTNEVSCDLEWLLHRYPMKMTKANRTKLKEKTKDHIDFLNKNSDILKSGYISPISLKLNEGMELRPYQKTAVELYDRMRRLLIADAIGIGKTPEAIGCLLTKNSLPAVVVVQAHLTHQWENEIKRFSKLKTHIINTGKYYDLPEADVYITKYTIMGKWVDVLTNMKLKTLIMDEVQEIRRTESIKHIACKKIADACENVIGLSGTPAINYGSEIWNIFHVINEDILDTKTVFNREWSCYDDKSVSNPKALGSYLRDKCAYIRRNRSDIGSEIPIVNRITHTVDYNKKDIDDMESEAKVLAIAMMQGQFIERGMAARELTMMVRKATGVSKARSVADYVKVIVESGEKVLLMGYHRDVYDIWNKELEKYKPVMYTGSESQKQKRQSFDQFTKKDAMVMMMSLRAGSAGLDGLQHCCRYIIFGELDWSGQIHDQAIGRLDRDGQKHGVTAIFLTTNSGSDPIVTDIIGLKKAQQKGIMDPFKESVYNHSNDSVIKKFAQSLLKKKGIKY